MAWLLTSLGFVATGVWSYDVGTVMVEVDGFVCSGKDVKIFHPIGDGPFPIVAYAHGMGGGVDGNDDALWTVASFGMTVLAPFTGGTSDACNSGTEYGDVLTALDAAKHLGEQLHFSLAKNKTDWTRTGIWGYSMGGKSIALSARFAASNFNLKAMLFSHGARKSGYVGVPSMYVTGSLDDSSSPPHIMKVQYDKNKAHHKVFVNFRGERHEEPSLTGRSSEWGAIFLSCHLHGDPTNCANIYSNGTDSLCSTHDLEECLVEGLNPQERLPAIV